MSTRKVLFPIILILLVALAPYARAATGVADAAAFMNDVGSHVLKIVNDKTAPDPQRKQEFTAVTDRSFDIPTITRFVLGRYWQTATDEEKQNFGKAFETYMIQVYWSHFSSYTGDTFKVTGTQDEGNGTILVRTNVAQADNSKPAVEISWSLVKQDDGFKIRDAALEGVSQAITYRDEFASIIEKSGGHVSGLITQLNERIKG
jgi:phospholipid transport system substrate-binding protein